LNHCRAGEVRRPELLRRTPHEERTAHVADPMAAAGTKVDEILAAHQPMSLPEHVPGGIKECLIGARPEARAVVERL